VLTALGILHVLLVLSIQPCASIIPKDSVSGESAKSVVTAEKKGN